MRGNVHLFDPGPSGGRGGVCCAAGIPPTTGPAELYGVICGAHEALRWIDERRARARRL